MNQNNSKICRLQSPTTLYRDIVSLANVVDVDWNTCIGSCHAKEDNISKAFTKLIISDFSGFMSYYNIS